MTDWIEKTMAKAKALYDEGTWEAAAVTPLGRDINRTELHVLSGSPPKGYLLVSRFYNTVVALDLHLVVKQTFTMMDDVMGSYVEAYNEAGKEEDPFEGL